MIPVILLIAGLILWLATGYDTAGVILTIAGGVLVAIQAVFLALGAAVLGKTVRTINREFDEADKVFNSRGR